MRQNLLNNLLRQYKHFAIKIPFDSLRAYLHVSNVSIKDVLQTIMHTSGNTIYYLNTYKVQ